MGLGLRLGLHFKPCKNEMCAGGVAFGVALYSVFFVFDPTNFHFQAKKRRFSHFSRGKITCRSVFAAHYSA